MDKREQYLGDGLYASFDGHAVTLRAVRQEGDHYVVLEPDVLDRLNKIVQQWRTEAAGDDLYSDSESAAIRRAARQTQAQKTTTHPKGRRAVVAGRFADLERRTLAARRVQRHRAREGIPRGDRKRGRLPRKRLDNLLRQPLRGRMPGHRKPQQLTPSVADNHKGKQALEAQLGTTTGQSQRCLRVIAQERPPALGRWAPSSDHVLVYGPAVRCKLDVAIWR